MHRWHLERTAVSQCETCSLRRRPPPPLAIDLIPFDRCVSNSSPPPPHATPCWLTHQLRSSIEAAAKNEWETPRRLGSTRISARVDRFEYCEHPDTHQKGGCSVAASETRSTRFMFKVNVKRSTTRRTRPVNRQRRRLFTDDGRRRCRR